MAKYDVTHSCGCTVTHQIYGTNSHGERERKAAWLAERPCWECLKKSKAEAAAATNADQIKLTGSDKQIAWAEQIREPAIKSLNEMKTKLAVKAEKFPQDFARACEVIDRVVNQASAAWWIDNRDVVIDARWVYKQMGEIKNA